MYVDYLEFKTPTWKRPEGPPRVWRVIDGRKKMENGEIPRFSIQEVPKELEDEVTEFMIQNFLREEPTCKDQGVINDQLAVRESRTLWRNIVHQGMSVVALLVNSDPAAKPVIAGVNILQVVTVEDEADTKSDIQTRSETMRHIFEIMRKLSAEADVLNKYGVDKYLSALGLSVNIAYRGQGLGEELLKARDDIGWAYKIPVSETVFTATASQILANRVGFEVIHQKKYSELVEDEGKPAYPGVTVEYMQVMAKRLY